MSAPRTCEDCGHELSPTADRCPGCGLDLAAQAAWEARVAQQVHAADLPLDTPAESPGRGLAGTPAGLGPRLTAAAVDLILVSVMGYGLAAALFVGLFSVAPGLEERLAGSASPDRIVGLTHLVVASLTTWVYFAAMESAPGGATIGKRLLGLRATDSSGGRLSFGRATGRHLARHLAVAPLGLGYLLAGLTRRRQGLHDLIAGTQVLRA